MSCLKWIAALSSDVCVLSPAHSNPTHNPLKLKALTGRALRWRPPLPDLTCIGFQWLHLLFRVFIILWV